MIKLIGISIVALTLSGCSLFKCEPDIEYIEKPMIHPERPASVSKPDVEFQIIVVEENEKKVPYVAIERNDGVEFANWLEELKAFTKKQNEMLCYYRADIEDPLCEK